MSRRLLILIALLTLVVGALSPVAAGAAQDNDGPQAPSGHEVVKSTTGSYIVVMTGDPLVVTEGQDNLNSKKAKNKGKALAKGHDKALNDAGVGADAKVQSFTNALNGFSAVMSYEEAKEVATLDGVAVVLPDEMRYLDTDSSPAFLGLDGPGGTWSTGVTGEGVIVGVIDSGIWPEHPSFADDGSYSDPGVTLEDSAANPACDFGNVAHDPNDVAFTCNNKLIGARQMLATYRSVIGAAAGEYDSARDDNGHGTHTASTAAGNAGVEASIFGQPLGAISGIAPRAHVIAYKGLGTLGGFTSDLASAIDQAVADGVDVINYSVGGGAAAPGGDEISFLFAASAGVFIATSAGNAGSGPATVGNPGTMPWMTTVGANTQTRFYQGTATLGDGSSYDGASVTLGVATTTLVDGEDAGGDLCMPGTLNPAMVDGNIVLCRRGAIARAAKSLAVSQAGGVGMILYENTDDNNLFTDTHWVPSVHIDNTPGLAVKAYIDAAGAGATAEITTGDVTEWASAPSMTIFSSRGPNAVTPDLIKPDITAPGMQILAGNTPTPLGGVQGELFQAIAGTSMSSPHIAGLFALLKQEHPDWTAAMAKSALMTTSHQDVVDNDRVSQANAFSMGAGHANPGRPVHKGSAFQPGLAYDAGLFEYAAYTCGQGFEVFSAGSCDFLEAIGVPSDSADLNVPSIGVAELAGTRTVTRTVTSVANENGWRTYNASVEAPDGYDVTVSPSQIRLKRGQSASFDVTITNNGGGPIGEWRHGSLTWNDTTGNYVVYSPIAVNGALFNAAAQVAGSGQDGAASFDVSFGYTGPYTAASHGLAADVVIVDNVPQDPDQTFNPADGFSNAHTFDLTGAVFARFALPPSSTEANADLDMFVFDPGGNLVATSTSGGTNEVVDLAAPAPGLWTVYVHGWQAPGGDSDYEMDTWVVPGAATSLSVDSAPASAAVGTVGTVEVSWAGLAAGVSYLGVVTHNDGSGVIGMTLIGVES